MPAHEVFSVDDVIQPSKIEHLVDESYRAGTKDLLYRYNFLRYEFRHPAGAIWARSYLDTIEHVAIYPPAGVGFDDDTVKRAVAYLSRRYADVRHLTDAGYESIFKKGTP